MTPAPYAPLWCKSHGSFLEGASSPEELVDEAARLGLAHVALTDRDGVYGIVRAHERARELGIALVIGAELSLDDGTRLVLLARDRAGYANLCGLITRGRLRSAKGSSSVRWQEVAEHAAGLVALWGGERSLIADGDDDAAVARAGGLLRDAFGEHAHALLARHRRAEEIASEARLVSRARRLGLPLVASTEVLYHRVQRRRLQDVLTCIRHGLRLASAGSALRANAEHDLKSTHALRLLYDDVPRALEASAAIASSCRFSLAELRYRYPTEAGPDGRGVPAARAERLRWLTFEGARSRYGGEVPDDVHRQLEKELELIQELDYGGYFLTMREIVDYCREHDILAQGRGSAANSAVCYCLGITAVDPVRMQLLFERFLSRERAEPPDIDLDIEHERREEVIQHVYTRFGRSHAAMVANVIRYRARSAVRDVGKVLGIPETALARVAGSLSYSDRLDEAFLRRTGLDPQAGAQRHLLELVAEIQDAPRHLSIHPGGFLLGHEPVSTLVPIENATMEDRTVIQWDKTDVEALGLFKVDLLGLGELSHLHRCFDLLRATRGRDLSLATVPPDDPATYEMIRRADTVGVFQIESRAQMAMLPRLAPRNYYDLVIEVAIVRPGPIAGGMVHPYLKRRSGEEPIEYPHECLRPVLEKTLGIPLFQEQVMKLAVVAADYTPGEADQLRRDMAAWQRTGSIERHRERLVERMRAKGIATDFAERVYQQIQGFGEYGFPESHAASFALLSYVGSWIKRHYPAEFACGLLNAQPMGFYSPATILDDAKRHGVVVRPIDVRHSAAECTLERDGDDFALRMGLCYVKGLGQREIGHIVDAARERPFESLADFGARARASTETLGRLAEAGALAGFEPERRSALWRARGIAPDDAQKLLVPAEPRVAFDPLDAFEEIGWDYVSSRHSTRGHPLEPLRAELAAAGLPCARDLARMQNGSEVDYAGLVICRQRPGTASGIVFMTLEDETGFANVVLYAHVFERQAELARAQPFLGVRGRLEVQSGVAHLVARELWQPRIARRPTEVGSRDFH